MQHTCAMNTVVHVFGVSTVARALGVSEGTVRNLAKRGILNPVRDSAGRRLFSPADVEAGRRHLARTAREMPA